uniref:Uncharacterized protein n=1 Tax=Esox lucius TaxID=8010 RepID=A0A3P8YAV2_ESOLU
MKCTMIKLLTAAVVMVSMCLLRDACALSIHIPLSAPLQNADTDALVQQVARHAQSSDTDTNVKLMPDVDTKKNHRDICCLHANILDFYLSNILISDNHKHPKLPELKEHLARVSKDLKDHGCVSSPLGSFICFLLRLSAPLSAQGRWLIFVPLSFRLSNTTAMIATTSLSARSCPR